MPDYYIGDINGLDDCTLVALEIKMEKLSRLYNFLYAKINGYSWTNCPVCNRFFGAHERGKYSFPIDGQYGYGKTVCKDSTCNLIAEAKTDEARVRAGYRSKRVILKEHGNGN